MLHDFEERRNESIWSRRIVGEFRQVQTWSEETEQRPRSSGSIRRRTTQTSIPTLARPVTGTQAKGFETVPGSQDAATTVTPGTGTPSQSAATMMTPAVSQAGGTGSHDHRPSTNPEGAPDRTVLAAAPAGALPPL